ncbi:hypothetical protein V6N13_067805 [Hibiscus sabdariffa]
MMQPWIHQAGVHASTASQLGATAPTDRPSSPWFYWSIQIWVQARNKRQLSLLIVRIQDVGSAAEALRDQVNAEGKEQSSSLNSSGSGSSSSDSKSSDHDSAISI